MKIPYSRLVLLTGLLMLSACFRPDRRSLTVAVPQMKSQDCANRVVASFKQGAAGAVEGIYTVTPNLQARTVTVEFDPQKLGFKNIEVTISSAGFDANDVLANPEAKAKLPPECR
jgi:copper chaperone CopZ